jgi:hypothetical protein
MTTQNIWFKLTSPKETPWSAVSLKDVHHVDGLKKAIKKEKSVGLKDYDADDLILMAKKSGESDEQAVELGNPRETMDKVLAHFGNDFEVLVSVPATLQSPPLKKMRLFDDSDWKDHRTGSGETVKLPPQMIDMINSTEFAPAPRSHFGILDGKIAGNFITLPRLGQTPKHFARGFQEANFFITEQMIDLWEQLEANSLESVKRVIAGPMGVGKSYLALFLAAKAYSKGWPLLYVADGGRLDTESAYYSSLEICKRFLALNSDILTPEDFDKLLQPYDPRTADFWVGSATMILCDLLMQKSRKTLLVIDEHGALFGTNPPAPVRLPLLVPLMNLSVWGETYLGARVILTGTAHARFERVYMVNGMQDWLIFVGPMTPATFDELLSLEPTLSYLRRDVHSITNCVPRELVRLAKYANQQNATGDNANTDFDDLFKGFYSSRKEEFGKYAAAYYEEAKVIRQESYRSSLSAMFMPTNRSASFDWSFMDLGLVYRIKVKGIVQHYPLCAPAMDALLDLYKKIPLPQDVQSVIAANNLTGEMFEDVLFTSLLKCSPPVVLNATNLNGTKVAPVKMNFSRYTLLQPNRIQSIGADVLVRFYAGYPRFDFALGYTFFQVSISNFTTHNTGSADILKAFHRPHPDERNDLEKYLDYAFAGAHTVNIDHNHFVVTRDNIPINDFRIVYLRGSGTGSPSHHQKVYEFPDVAHVSFSELKKSLIGLLFL